MFPSSPKCSVLHQFIFLWFRLLALACVHSSPWWMIFFCADEVFGELVCFSKLNHIEKGECALHHCKFHL